MQGQKVLAGRLTTQLKRHLDDFLVRELSIETVQAPHALDVGDRLDVESQDRSHGKYRLPQSRTTSIPRIGAERSWLMRGHGGIILIVVKFMRNVCAALARRFLICGPRCRWRPGSTSRRVSFRPSVWRRWRGSRSPTPGAGWRWRLPGRGRDGPGCRLL